MLLSPVQGTASVNATYDKDLRANKFPFEMSFSLIFQCLNVYAFSLL